MPTYLGKRDASLSYPESLEYIGGSKTTRKRFREVYLFLADDTSEDAADILADSNLPALDSTDADGHIIHRRSPKEVSTLVHPATGVATTLWEVTVEGDDRFEDMQEGGGGGQDMTVEILNGATIETWDSVEEEEYLSHDIITGAPCRNVNGEPILIYRKVAYPQVTMERLEDYPYAPATMYLYGNTVNSTEFKGAPPGWAFMYPPKAEPYLHDNIIKCKVAYRIKFRVENIITTGTRTIQQTTDPAGGWDYTVAPGADITPFKERVLHQGTLFKKVGEDGSLDGTAVDELPLFRATDDSGNPKTVNLDEHGFEVSSSPSLTAAEKKLPTYIQWNKYRTSNFADLGLS